MSERKVTDQEWADARKRYETEPGLGLGKIAQALDCSKSLVARKAREERWQKDFGVPSQVHPTAREREANFTESPVHPAKQAVHVHDAEPSGSPARVVADVFVPPTAAQGVGPDKMQIPDDLDPHERHELVRAAIVERQRAVNALQSRELGAVKAKLYAAIKACSTKEGPALALAVQRNVQSLVAVHDAEMEREISKVKLDLAEFAGLPATPRPCKIVVHLLPGERFGGSAAYGANVTEVIDSQGVINVRN